MPANNMISMVFIVVILVSVNKFTISWFGWFVGRRMIFKVLNKSFREPKFQQKSYG